MFIVVNCRSKLYVVFIFYFGFLYVFYSFFKVFAKDTNCHHNQKKKNENFDISVIHAQKRQEGNMTNCKRMLFSTTKILSPVPLCTFPYFPRDREML